MAFSNFTPSVLTIQSTGTTGTGQGELNVVTNPSATTDLTSWTAVPPSGFASRDATGSPLDPVVPTGFNLSTSASGQTFTSDALTVPTSLRNRKLKLEFYMTQATAAFKVDVLKSDGSTRFPLTTDSGNVSNLPALSASGKFTTYFDMDSGSSIQVRFTSILASGTLKVTQVIVGPGIQPQGAVVGEWQSYTPTIDGFGTVTPLEARYRRVGSSIEVVAKWTNGTPAASQARVYVPTGLTVAAASQTQVVGRWYRDSATGSARKSSPILQLNSAQQYVIFSSDDYTTASGPYTGLNGSALAVAGENVGVNFTVPIAEWAGSGTVTLAQNDVEYAWNSDTSNATNLLAFGYGPSGTRFGSYSSTLAKRVRFQTPIQPGDQLVLEVLDSFASTQNYFLPVAQVAGYASTSTTTGMSIVQVSATDVDVYFGSAGYGGSVIRAAGGWANVAATDSYKWRVRKSSAGAAVGFGIVQPGVSSGLVSSLGLPGKTDGLPVTSGYVGEKIDWAGLNTTSNIAEGAGYQEVGNGTTRLPLSRGVYLVIAAGDAAVSDTTTRMNCQLNTFAGSATITPLGNPDSMAQLDNAVAVGLYAGFTNTSYVHVTADNTVLRIRAVLSGGSATNARVVSGCAIRIA